MLPILYQFDIKQNKETLDSLKDKNPANQRFHGDNINQANQLGLFNPKTNKQEAPAFQFCSLRAEKSTELEIIATQEGYRLHWQAQPIGIHLSHSEATILAERLQKRIDAALRNGEEIDFESRHWREAHTSLLKQIVEQGGDES